MIVALGQLLVDACSQMCRQRAAAKTPLGGESLKCA